MNRFTVAESVNFVSFINHFVFRAEFCYSCSTHALYLFAMHIRHTLEIQVKNMQ